MKKVTFEDVAKELNVSKGLVSLAMRNKYGVSEEMRSKIVLKAIDMGYKMEMRSTKSVKSIALFIKQMSVLKEEFWRDIVFGIEQQAAKEKLVLKVFTASAQEGADAALDLYDSDIRGVIFLNQATKKTIKEIEKFGIPMVLVDMINPVDGNYDQVMANNYGGGLQAVNHLISRGHKNIIFFGNKDYSHSFRQRFYGCQYGVDRATNNNIQINYLVLSSSRINNGNSEIYEDDDYVICNPEDLKRYLVSGNRYSAVICLNDGALRFAKETFEELNLSVPDDVSVISFDNTSIAKDTTSINVPKKDMGINAVKMLIEKINKTRIPTATFELNTNLIDRNSVKDIN